MGRREMVLGEIFIDVVFVAALLAAVACLVYLSYVTILERRLLRARRAPVRANATGEAARVVSSTVAASPATARDFWSGSAGSPALPESRG
jgi:hypothetical protein